MAESSFHTAKQPTRDPMNNKSNEPLGPTLLRAELFAHRCMLLALIESHPNKQVLREHFAHYTEKYISSALGHGADDVAIHAFERSAEHLMGFLSESDAGGS
jgi:hypothetical protein